MSSSIGIISNNLNQELLPLVDRMNVIYSPLSLTLALLLVYLGAGGQTRLQLKNVLGINISDDNLLKDINRLITMSNANIGNAFIMRERYVIRDNYAGQIASLKTQIIPFKNSVEAAQRSNLWVNLQTKGLIPNLLSPMDINPATNIIIINTIYFKGKWLNEFSFDNNIKAPFETYEGPEVILPLMRETMNIAYYDHQKYQLIELPYQNQSIVMGIVLPKKPAFLNEFLSNPSVIPIGQVKTNIDKIEVYLPKFTHRQRLSPTNLFKTLGINDLFDQSKANLSLINDSVPPLYVSNIIHEAVIKVNEKGTEAAAATAMMMRAMAMPPGPVEKITQFRADHTFYYYLRDTTNNAIYFSGIYNGTL